MLLKKLCISKSAVLNFAHTVSPKTHAWVCKHFKELKNKIQDLAYAYIKSILTLNSADPNLCFEYDLPSISQYLQCFLIAPSLHRLAVQSPHSGKVQTSSGFKVRAADCTVLPQEFWSLSAADCELVSMEARCEEAESPQPCQWAQCPADPTGQELYSLMCSACSIWTLHSCNYSHKMLKKVGIKFLIQSPGFESQNHRTAQVGKDLKNQVQTQPNHSTLTALY